jgi:hypothetical protein
MGHENSSGKSSDNDAECWILQSLFATVISPVIPAKAGIQNCLKILDSGSRFACPE